MPRVETIVPAEPIERADPAPPRLLSQYVRLRADQILIDPVIAKARSGPVPASERVKIESLALSMRTVGQLVPIIVEEISSATTRQGGKLPPSGKLTPSTSENCPYRQYRLVDGWRRVQAAKHINTTVDPGFELVCVVRESTSDPLEPLRAAVHANLKRRGLSPIQFAYLCQELRSMNGWKGTRELADYLQVSRATISQHDKLLAKPEGMDQATYEDLLSKLANGSMGAEAAFELLTHVEPTQAAQVLEKATEKAVQAHQETTQETTDPSPPANGSAPSPAPKKKTKAKAAPKSKTPTITRAHIRQAAQETGAVVAPTSKDLPELRKLFEQMRASTYPDVMRSFVSLLAEEWWRGDCKDKDVLAQWNQLATLVKQAQAGHSKRLGR